MHSLIERVGVPRRLLLRRVVGAGVLVAIAGHVRAAEAEVVIDNFTFAPTPLRVKQGTKVTWVNHDDIPHSIVCPPLNVKSHVMDTDGTFALVFDKAGRFDYICGLHPHMRGMVVVDP